MLEVDLQLVAFDLRHFAVAAPDVEDALADHDIARAGMPRLIVEGLAYTPRVRL